VTTKAFDLFNNSMHLSIMSEMAFFEKHNNEEDGGCSINTTAERLSSIIERNAAPKNQIHIKQI
jgi:hypothetical protein